MAVNRSFLFAPGNHERKVVKALGLDADAAVLDLEDAVAVAEKAATRGLIVDALQRPRSCRAYVRVNAFDTPYCFADLTSVVGHALDGILLPKVESAAQMVAIDWVLGELERERGLVSGSIDLVPIIETGQGVVAVDSICRAPVRVRRVAFGAGDYTLDMGMRWTRGERELDHARSAIALASRTAGLEPPLDTVFVHLGEIEDLRRSATLARDMGYQGKMCIHPEQVAPVNEIYTPTAEQIERARHYVKAFEAAEAAGSASIQVDGYFVDYPIVAQARRTLAIAGELERLSSAGG